jgi:hypothetical protein
MLIVPLNMQVIEQVTGYYVLAALLCGQLYRGNEMTESQINTLVFVVLVRKYMKSLNDESLQLSYREKCIKMIMEKFGCGYARACHLFSETHVAV